MRRLVVVLLVLAAALAAWLALRRDERGDAAPTLRSDARVETPTSSSLLIATGTKGREARRGARAKQAAPARIADSRAPLSDDVVRFLVSRASDSTRIRGAEIRLHASKSDVLRAVTDEEGVATLPMRGADATYEVVAAGFVKTVGVVAYRFDHVKFVDLHGAAEAVGRVVDFANGKPIAGARVLTTSRLDDVEAARDAEPWRALEVAVTDDDGMFRLKNAPNGAPNTGLSQFSVSVEAVGHVAVKMDAARELGAPSWRIRLDPAARVCGVTRTPNGAALPGVSLRAVSIEDSGSRTSTSDASGRFEIDGLRESMPYALSATSGEFVGRLDVVPVRDDASLHEIVLHQAATLVVHVMDADGKPATPAQVELKHRARGATPTKKGTADGSNVVVLTGAAPGEYDLDVTRGNAHVRRLVELAEGARVEITATPIEPWTVRGRVVDDVGAPVTDVYVSGGRSSYQAPDADGEFVLFGLEPERQTIVVRRRFDEVVAETRVDAPTDDLRVVVPRPTLVTFTCAPTIAEVFVSTMRGRDLGSPAERKDGRFTVLVQPSPSEPRNEIALIVPSHVPVVRSIVCVPGGRVDLGEVDFEKGATLVGRVVDDAGRPASARVSVASVDGPGRGWMETGPDGAFATGGLAPGTVDVFVESDEFAPTHVRAKTGGATPLVVTLFRGGLVHVRLEPAANHAENLVLEAFDATGAKVVDDVEADHFRCRLPAGKCRVAARRRDAKPTDPDVASAEVDVVEGGDHEVVLRVAR